MSVLGFCYFLASTLLFAKASKCPEARKAHAQDCASFYNCVDLPNGQHAWFPAKCDDGLEFEPYFLTCVVPENSKSCQNRLQNSKIITKYNRQRPSSFPWNFMNNQLELLLPPNDTENDKNYSISKNVSTALNVLDADPTLDLIEKCKNFHLPSSEKQGKIFSSFVNNVLNKMLLNCDRNSFTNNPNFKSNYAEYCNDVFQFCLSLTTSTPKKDDENKFDETAINENNVISITNNLGNKQYVSIKSYSSLKEKLTSETVIAVSCVDGIRSPNMTDCRKYYTCDSKFITIKEFVCPANTAFNEQKRKCDRKKYETCFKDKKFNHFTTVAKKNPCVIPGKIADPNSEEDYFLCYTNNENLTLSFVRLSCPANTVFCQKTRTCTLKSSSRF